MSSAGDRYLHGTFPEEQQRLSLLNGILNQASLDALRLLGGESVLDLGCGLAQFSRAMARAVGREGRVLGIERSPEQLAEAARQAQEEGERELIELRQGDVLDLTLGEHEWGSFDVAHARFVLEHVADPLAVVRAMLRAVRPGGRIVLEDDDHEVIRLWPEPAGWGPLWQAYMRTFDRNGNDPYVGRRLVSLLHQAGAAPVRNTSLFFGGCAGTAVFPAMVENTIGLLQGLREPILELGMFDATAFDEGIAALRMWGSRPDAALWFGVCWAEGVRRP